MARCGLALFCLVALFSSAAMASLDGGDSGRQLLQSPDATDCDRSVANCLTCRYQFYRATITRAICLTCKVGYVVKASGRGCCEFLGWSGWAGGAGAHDESGGGSSREPCACLLGLLPGAAGSSSSPLSEALIHHLPTAISDTRPHPTPPSSIPLNPSPHPLLGCAPGYYLSAPDTCTKCGLNSYCAGAKTTPAADQVPCGDNKLTTTEFAKSDRECVVQAGYGWAPGNGSVICDAGAYNPGFNTRACTRCPGGLTTADQGTNSSTACQAPAGFYYLRGKAIACAQGFYKPNLANADCTSCPDGWTTKFGEVSKTAAADCTCE
jgi:hypothetical protein